MRDAKLTWVVMMALAWGGLSGFTGCDVASNAGADPNAATTESQETGLDSTSNDQEIQQRESTDAKRLINRTTQENDQPEKSEDPSDPSASDVADQAEQQTIEIPSSWIRLGKQEEIWIDKEAKEVIIAGHVCLNNGPLEMFICPQHTKEHESIISANATALQVHLALIALGAEPGKATSWDPEYRAAYGPTIEVSLKWKDPDSKSTRTASANQWIRDMKTRKPLEHTWVFGGSQFWEDPDSNEKIYYGDSGELICLSNFSTATIDLNVESSQSNDGLLFEAFTENIPPLGTKVYAIIKPGKRIEPPKSAKEKPQESSQPDNSETGDQASGSAVDLSNSK